MQVLMIDGGGNATGLLADRLACSGFRPMVHPMPFPAREVPDGQNAEAIIVSVEPHVATPANAVQALRNEGMEQPLMVLSSRCDWRERVEALDAGADDYLVMPYRSEEVAARLRALIRRRMGACSSGRFGDFTCDIKASRIWLDGVPLDLTRNEFRLLQGFLLRADFVLSRQQIANLLYTDDPENRTDNAVEVYISRLRRKIGKDRIRTIRGLGYHVLVSQG